MRDSVQSIDGLWKWSQSSPRKMSVEPRLVTANSIRSAWSPTIIQTSVNPSIDPSAFRVPSALYTGILIGRVRTVRWFFFTNSRLIHDPVAPLSRRAFALSWEPLSVFSIVICNLRSLPLDPLTNFRLLFRLLRAVMESAWFNRRIARTVSSDASFCHFSGIQAWRCPMALGNSAVLRIWLIHSGIQGLCLTGFSLGMVDNLVDCSVSIVYAILLST